MPSTRRAICTWLTRAEGRKSLHAGGQAAAHHRHAGRRQTGAYDVNRLANLGGIAIDQRSHLWVAEPDYQPKRTSLWTTAGKFLNEFIGPARYGGGGCIDPQTKSRFYYQGMEFALDWNSGAWKVQNILTRSQPAFSGGYTDHPVYLNGKQYMVNDPGVNSNSELLLIGEFRKDHVAPLTVAGNAELWQPFRDDAALRKLVDGKPLNTYSFVWSDANGDGLPQAEEVTLSPQGIRLTGTYWPSLVSKKLEVQMGNRLLKPTGYTKCGAPVYQPFGDDVKLAAFPVENIYATAVDSQGRVLINGRPVTALTPNGTVDWSYPQHWVGIHDSHVAPSAQPGQMIGALGFIGQEDMPRRGPHLHAERQQGGMVSLHRRRDAGRLALARLPLARRGQLELPGGETRDVTGPGDGGRGAFRRRVCAHRRREILPGGRAQSQQHRRVERLGDDEAPADDHKHHSSGCRRSRGVDCAPGDGASQNRSTEGARDRRHPPR